MSFSSCVLSCCILDFIFLRFSFFLFFFFNDTATTEIYTLSLHDALPICADPRRRARLRAPRTRHRLPDAAESEEPRSEEHTSELQSLTNLVCRLLLEKKKKKKNKQKREDNKKTTDK